MGFTEYKEDLIKLLSAVDNSKLEKICDKIARTKYGRGRIFVAGNGGSASTVNHFTSDFSKNAVQAEEGKFAVISLSSLVEAITAYGNDDGYENSFKNQLRNFYPNENDVFIGVSVSGNSPNIVKAAEYCNEKGASVISITGFKGGKVAGMSDINITIPSESYERVEDIQSMILHMITYSFKEKEAPAEVR